MRGRANDESAGDLRRRGASDQQILELLIDEVEAGEELVDKDPTQGEDKPGE